MKKTQQKPRTKGPTVEWLAQRINKGYDDGVDGSFYATGLMRETEQLWVGERLNLLSEHACCILQQYRSYISDQ